MSNANHLIISLFLLSVIATKLIVQTPPALKSYFQTKYPDQGIPYSIANFGTIPYGKTITGQITIPSVLEDCVYEDIPDNYKNRKIILVERNDCTFTQKAINIEQEGGKMAIIMDSQIQHPRQIVMVDDGKGNQISIPTILISKEDGNAILNFINNQEGVVARVSFDVNKRKTGEIQIWIDLSDRKSIIFLRNFQPFYTKIKSHINFTIGYTTNRCSYCSDDNCFYNKSYCKVVKNSFGVQNAGQELIQEQLRQYFIFKESADLWWDYMLRYDDQCNDLAMLEECSSDIMSNIGIKPKKIITNVKNSFNKNDNHVLNQMQTFRDNNGIVFFPSIIVNKQVYRGNLEPIDIFQMICSSFAETPHNCYASLGLEESNIWIWVMSGIVFFLIFLIFLIGCYRRYVRRALSNNINKNVNELVNQYITMYENDKFATK